MIQKFGQVKRGVIFGAEGSGLTPSTLVHFPKDRIHELESQLRKYLHMRFPQIIQEVDSQVLEIQELLGLSSYQRIAEKGITKFLELKTRGWIYKAYYELQDLETQLRRLG